MVPYWSTLYAQSLAESASSMARDACASYARALAEGAPEEQLHRLKSKAIRLQGEAKKAARAARKAMKEFWRETE